MEATVHATGREEVGEGRVVLLDGVVLHDQLVDEGVDLGDAMLRLNHHARTHFWMVISTSSSKPVSSQRIQIDSRLFTFA